MQLESYYGTLFFGTSFWNIIPFHYFGTSEYWNVVLFHFLL